MSELATVDASSEVAVTSYLQQARDWLATAVESTGPEQIARAKAEIATAAEATKQLHLSKDIQGDASEMVRRAEYTLRKATQKAQEAGEVRGHGGDRRSSSSPDDLDSKATRDFFTSQREYEDANAMADLDTHQFDEVLAEARDEGNLSRANVAAKSRQKRTDILADLSARYVEQFPALAFFRDRGEHQRVNALGRDLAAMDLDEQAMRLGILDKTIAYEKREEAGEPHPEPHSVISLDGRRAQKRPSEHRPNPDAEAFVECVDRLRSLMHVVDISEVAASKADDISEAGQLLSSFANRMKEL